MNSPLRLPGPTAPSRLGWVSLITLFLASFPVLGQESQYSLTAWKVEDGLPQGSVRSITQTKDGYLWVATWNGLARFDGIRFTTFHSANTPALLSSNISNVFGDSRGALWVGTDGGGAVRYEHGVFTRIDSSRGVPAARILDINEDRQGRVWLSTELGFYGIRNDSVLHFSGRNGLPHDYAGSVIPAPDGTMYFCTVHDVSRAHILGDSLVIEKTFPFGSSRADIDTTGALWYFLPGKGLTRRVGDKVSVDRRFLGPGLWDVFFPGDGRMWFATNDGLYIFGRDHTELLKQVDGVTLDRVVVVFRDREGNIWMGNTGKGLLRLRPKLLHSFSKTTGFVSDFVMCGLQDRTGSLWIGTWDKGLYRHAPSAGTITPRSFARARLPVPTASIIDLEEFRDGTVWIGTWGLGVFTYRDKRFTPFHQGMMKNDFTIPSIAEGADGSVWIGTAHDGVFHYSGLREDRWTTQHGLGSDEIKAVTCQRNGDVWVGTSGGGVSRISNGTVETFSRRQGLTDNFVSTIIEDREGTVWIATARGLNRWKPNHPGVAGSDGTISPITERQGLYDDATDQLIESGDDLWVGSIHGIYRVSKKELNDVADGVIDQVHCLRLGKSDGMISEECGAKGNSCAWKTQDGRLWFSTPAGAVAFDPATIGTTARSPDVTIEEVAVENKPVAFGSELILQPGETKLDVHYTGFNFASPRSLRFKYFLDGSDKGWVDAGGERVAHYTNLDPGHYGFRVIASNSAGVWNERGASLEVTVLPPFWATWWFRVGAFIVIVGSIGWTIRAVELRKFREKMHAVEREAALERERLRIARDLHDELGARLTEIGLMTDFAQKEKKAGDRTERLKDIATTARSVIDSFREIVWTVGPQHDSLDSLAEYLAQYTSNYLRKAGIRCRLDIPEQIPDAPIRSEMRHSILMAVKEAANNIAKHSGATEVRFGLLLEDSTCRITVEDNGKGFPSASHRRFSYGVGNMKKRMEEIGGTAELVSEKGKGTTAVFTFPIGMKSNG